MMLSEQRGDILASMSWLRVTARPLLRRRVEIGSVWSPT